MSSGGVTEIIWHFAGYLQLSDDMILWRTSYEDGALEPKIEDFQAAPIRDANPDFRLDLFPIHRTFPDIVVDEEPLVAQAGFFRAKVAAAPVSAEPGDLLSIPPTKAIVPMSFGSGGLFIPPPQNARYTPGGDDKLIDVRQTNYLSDNDRFAHDFAYWQLDYRALLDSALADAGDFIPQDLRVPDGDSSEVLVFLTERDAARDPEQSHPDHVEVGHFVNGVLQTGDDPVETEPAVEAEEVVEDGPIVAIIDGDWKVGQEVVLGSNETVNAALIVDANEASLGMVVVGNYYATDAIIQVTIARDVDHVTVANGTGHWSGEVPGSTLLDGNSFTNDATFEVESIPIALPNGKGGVLWNVEHVDGDFYDVKLLRQLNVLLDNDVSSQTTYDVFSLVETGGNQLINLASLFDFGKTYDLIIIGGDYHKSNLIYQTNILLDDDLIRIFAEDYEGIGSAVAQTARAGENELLNEALIRNIGETDIQNMTPDVESLVAAIAAQDGSIAASLAWQILGMSGVVDVLYVSGNYYDVNMVSQINIVADLDMALQDMAGGGVINTDEITQTASTGDNSLTNTAAIIDVGTLTSAQYVGGEYYSDTILIQAEIIADDDENITVSDTTSLVPEVIAFAGEAQDEDNYEIAPVKDTLQQSDMLGNILT